jgi:hypothetical protein
MRRILGVIGVTLAAGLVMTASAASATNRGGGKAFVGPADDAFFVDLGTVQALSGIPGLTQISPRTVQADT